MDLTLTRCFALTLVGVLVACSDPAASGSPDLAPSIDPAAFIDLAEDDNDDGALAATKALARAHAEAYDLDDAPLHLRWDEYSNLMADPKLARDALTTRSAKNTLRLLRPLFMGEPFVLNDPGPRLIGTSAKGARVEYYANSECYLERLNHAIEGMSKSSLFVSTLLSVEVVMTPPDGGLELLPEFGPGYEEYGGLAVTNGLDARNRPTMVIRADSFDTWDLTFAHELLHFLHTSLPSAEKQRIAAEYARFAALPTFAADADPYLNQREMFAFFGQWYLAGYGDFIAAKSAPLGELFSGILGSARVSQRGAGQAKAEAHLELLWKQYTTGVIDMSDYDALLQFESEPVRCVDDPS